MTKQKPLFTHDCTACQFQGQDRSEPGETPLLNQPVDIYLHFQPDAICIIRRFSHEGRDYSSCTVFESQDTSHLRPRWAKWLPKDWPAKRAGPTFKT